MCLACKTLPSSGRYRLIDPLSDDELYSFDRPYHDYLTFFDHMLRVDRARCPLLPVDLNGACTLQIVDLLRDNRFLSDQAVGIGRDRSLVQHPDSAVRCLLFW